MLNYPRMLSPSAAQPPQHPSSRCSSESDPYKVRGGSPRCDVAERQTKPAPLYLARITVLGRRADLRMVDRGDFDPVSAELFKVIIGTDMLQVCRFTYNDPPGKFTLEYQPTLMPGGL